MISTVNRKSLSRLLPRGHADVPGCSGVSNTIVPLRQCLTEPHYYFLKNFLDMRTCETNVEIRFVTLQAACLKAAAAQVTFYY